MLRVTLPTQTGTYKILLAAYILICFFGSIHKGWTQSALHPDTKVKLQTRVHLSLGKTTLAKALEVLSKQTGLTIEASPGLSERVLLVEMNDITASNALNALAICNEWNWSETTPGNIRLRRSLPRNPTTLEEVQKFVVAALPKDVRDFVCIGKSVAEIKNYTIPIDPQLANTPFAKPPVNRSLSMFSQGKIFAVDSALAREISALLKPKPTDGAYYAYKTLTPEIQEKLLLYALLYTLKETRSGLLYNEFAPFQKDPNKVTVELKGSSLDVGSHTIQGTSDVFQSFGMDIGNLLKDSASKQ